MNKRERLNRILQMVNEHGTINNNEMIEMLQVSDMTIRRDLDELESAGKLIRFHGGAQSVNYSLDFELLHLEKTTVNMDQKKQIASKAASLVREGDSIFLGPGTTVEIMASLLAGKQITVVTNSLEIFTMLAESRETQLILAGGIRRDQTSCFAGPIANRTIGNIFYDKAFVSCNGIFAKQFTTSSLEEADTMRLAMKNSKSCYLFADLSKFSHQDKFAFGSLSELDAMIVNSPVPEGLLQTCQSLCTVMEV